jgi:hypothetical protein
MSHSKMSSIDLNSNDKDYREKFVDQFQSDTNGENYHDQSKNDDVIFIKNNISIVG